MELSEKAMEEEKTKIEVSSVLQEKDSSVLWARNVSIYSVILEGSKIPSLAKIRI